MHEVERWEEQHWERMKSFVGGSPEKQRLTREWRANCWRRLDANICAMDARMDAAKTKANSNESDVSRKWQTMHDDIQRAWQVIVERFMEREILSSSRSMPMQILEGIIRKITEHRWWWPKDSLSVERLRRQREEMAIRSRKELDDIEFRLTQGLERCDQFWVDEQLLECRRSRSNTLYLDKLSLEAPLEVYSRALKQNNTTTHIIFRWFDSDDDRRWIADTIRDLPWVTSIYVPNRELLPTIDRTTPLFIDDYDGQDINTFLDNDSQLAHSQGTFIFIIPGTIAVSFVGPTSGNLILRLTHRSTTTLTVTGASVQLSLSSLLTVDDITLHASPSESDKPSFEPGIRNNLIIQVVGWYSAHDIRLLDQSGNCHDAASQSPEGVSAARCVLLSIMVDPLQLLTHRDLLQSPIKSFGLGVYIHLEVLTTHHAGYCAWSSSWMQGTSSLPSTAIDSASSKSWCWNNPVSLNLGSLWSTWQIF